MKHETRSLTVAIDLDGTLCEYDGWRGPAHFGPPNLGMVELLHKFREKGWTIVIWTTRRADNALRRHLNKHGIPYDFINKNPKGPQGNVSPKIYADVYLDDRAFRFEGKTDGLFEQIEKSVKPWFEKTESKD